MFLSEMFGGQEILEWAPFRVTRNGDVEIDEDSRLDLMIDMQEMLQGRETSQCVRLEISASASGSLTGFLCDGRHRSGRRLRSRRPVGDEGPICNLRYEGIQSSERCPLAAPTSCRNDAAVRTV